MHKTYAKSDNPDPVVAGNDVTYTVTVYDNGPNTAARVVLTDTLPAGVTFNTATPSAGSCSESGGTVTCNLGDISSGSSVTITIVITTTAAGTITNTASVSAATGDSNSSNNSASASTQVNPASLSADLAVTKTDVADPVVLGGNVIYNIAVSNAGPDDSSGVVMTDTLPAGVTFNTATPSAGSCSEAGGTVTCNLGNMASGANANVTIRVTADAVGPISNTAVVSSSTTDPNNGNNTATEDTVVQNLQADVEVVSVDDGQGLVWPNSTTTYTVVVRNNGPAPTTGVAISQSVTPGGALASQNWICTPAGGASCSSGSGSGAIDQNVDLPVGGTVTFTVDIGIHINAGGDEGPPYSFTYQVTASGGTVADPNGGNNTASDTNGYHTISIVLDWGGSTADIDLEVTDPGGYTIDYGSYVGPSTSPTGGSLSGDTNYICTSPIDPAQESVNYPNGGPTGTYSIEITYYQTCTWTNPIGWTLTIVIDGSPTVVQSGTINTEPSGSTVIWSGTVSIP